MPSDQKIFTDLIRYIEHALKSGKSEAEIKAELLKLGHREDLVLHHFSYLHRKRHRLAYLIAALLVIVLLAALLFSLRPKPALPLTAQQQFDLAVGVRNETLCNALNATEDRQACIATVEMRRQVNPLDYQAIMTAWNNNNFAACARFSGYARDMCVDALDPTVNVTTLAQCAGMRTGYMRIYCESTQHFKHALATRNSTECSLVILPFGTWRICESQLG